MVTMACFDQGFVKYRAAIKRYLRHIHSNLCIGGKLAVAWSTNFYDSKDESRLSNIEIRLSMGQGTKALINSEAEDFQGLPVLFI